MHYEFITYFVLALRRTVRKLCHASVFSSTLLYTNFLLRTQNKPWWAEGPKSLSMTGSHPFQWTWQIAQIFTAK